MHPLIIMSKWSQNIISVQNDKIDDDAYNEIKLSKDLRKIFPY